ncbi:hypothetical protein EV401DRAFT_1883129 [Pisolithus croceorrhizus]|nr:hypothetical protein EV401DRAFT_1883129 [Pisolithus croceorrhizus]
MGKGSLKLMELHNSALKAVLAPFSCGVGTILPSFAFSYRRIVTQYILQSRRKYSSGLGGRDPLTVAVETCLAIEVPKLTSLERYLWSFDTAKQDTFGVRSRLKFCRNRSCSDLLRQNPTEILWKSYKPPLYPVLLLRKQVGGEMVVRRSHLAIYLRSNGSSEETDAMLRYILSGSLSYCTVPLYLVTPVTYPIIFVSGFYVLVRWNNRYAEIVGSASLYATGRRASSKVEQESTVAYDSWIEFYYAYSTDGCVAFPGSEASTRLIRELEKSTTPPFFPFLVTVDFSKVYMRNMHIVARPTIRIEDSLSTQLHCGGGRAGCLVRFTVTRRVSPC